MEQTLRRTITAALVAGLMVIWLGSLSAQASVDDFEFDSFDAVYELGIGEDGVSTLRTTETLVAVFPSFDQNRGIARYLPTRYLGQPLPTEVLGVFDDTGKERQWSAFTEGQALVVESVVPAGEYVRGEQTYVFDYRSLNVIRDFSDSSGLQEFYWDVNGSGWSQPFGRVTATVRVPAELAAGLSATGESCFQGPEGSTTPCTISREERADGGVVFEASAGGLGPNETMTIAIGFLPDTFVAPAARAIAPVSIAAHVAAIIAGIAGLVWAVAVRVRKLRDAPGRPVIIPEYLPPKNATLEVASTLRHHTGKLPLAGLLALAVSGKARLMEEKGWGKNWSLVRTDIELTPDDEKLLTVLFGSVPREGEAVRLPKNSTTVAKRLDEWVASVRATMRRDGYFHTVPLVVRMGPILVALLAGILGVAGFVLAGEDELRLFTGVAGVSAIALAIVAIALVAKTPLGAAGSELRDYLKGLALYIGLAEKDRLHFLQSPEGALREKISVDDPRQVLKLYERLLPWAVVVGEEKRWMKELDRLYRDESPTWVTGSDTRFLSSLSSLSAATQSSFRSSSTGGTSGGGSAGGGGGGGGGGGR